MGTKQKTINFMAVLLVLVGLISLPTVVGAGDLEPDGPPGPTMKTLDEVEPRIPIPGSNTPAATFYINQSGSYYLTGDRTASSTAIVVEANDVTIDLSGYNLIGAGGSYGIYMYGRSNVEIRNGTVRNFGYHGIYAAGASNSGLCIINIRSQGNNWSGIYLGGNGHLVKDCVVSGHQSGVYGAIRLGSTTSDGNSCTVTANLVFDNSYRGIEAIGKGCTITDNTVYGNGNIGIMASSYGTVTGNVAYDNAGQGISAGYGSTVSGNTACNNTSYGIYAGYGSTVNSNTAYNNQSSGIYAGTGSTVTGNTAYYNQYYGIYLAGNSLVDQNTAYNNNQSGGGYTNIRVCGTCTFGTNHAP